MGHIMSPVKSIRNLSFGKWCEVLKSSKDYEVKLVRVGNLTLIETKNNNLICDKVDGGCAYGFGGYHWITELLKALVIIGRITPLDADTHQAAVDKVKAVDVAEEDLSALDSLIKKYKPDGMIFISSLRDLVAAKVEEANSIQKGIQDAKPAPAAN